MSDWLKVLKKANRLKENERIELISNLKAPLPYWTNEGYDGVISLNLLGQIPIYWRDRVLSRCPELSTDMYLALKQSMGELQLRHVEALRKLRCKRTILISDTEYYYYKSDQSEWTVEQALYGGVKDAIDNIPAYKKDAWFWHLAPQFVEDQDCGEIHRVEAWGW